MAALLVGQTAPDFALPDQDGKQHRLSDYAGNWVLLYFYPKDDTPGCTKEACAFRDNFPDFGRLEMRVIGISVDSVKSHARFAAKYRLPFTLLSDEGKDVVSQYGVWGGKKLAGRAFGMTHRTSFLVDREGKIAKIYQKVKPETHAQEVLGDLEQLKK